MGEVTGLLIYRERSCIMFEENEKPLESCKQECSIIQFTFKFKPFRAIFTAPEEIKVGGVL